VLLRLALFFIVELYREPISVEKRDSIFHRDSGFARSKAGSSIRFIDTP